MVIPVKQIDVREIILVMTYSVVFFSILIQGSGIVPLINKAKAWQEKHLKAETTFQTPDTKKEP